MRKKYIVFLTSILSFCIIQSWAQIDTIIPYGPTIRLINCKPKSWPSATQNANLTAGGPTEAATLMLTATTVTPDVWGGYTFNGNEGTTGIAFTLVDRLTIF